jgi:hypothetical protein
MLSASKSVKKFLDVLPIAGLRGKLAFAFDTKLEGRMAGSAGKYIEKRLERLSLEILPPLFSAIVRGMNKEEQKPVGNAGAPAWVQKLDKSKAPPSPNEPPHVDLLRPGSELGFEELGQQLGLLLVCGVTQTSGAGKRPVLSVAALSTNRGFVGRVHQSGAGPDRGRRRWGTGSGRFGLSQRALTGLLLSLAT